MFHALLAADTYNFWLPNQGSSQAHDIDALFYFILWVNVFFSTLIMAGLIIFVIRYRHRAGTTRHDPTGGHSTALELTWTILPTLLTLVIFYYGFRGYLHASVMPPNTYEVTATGRMWNWSFSYPTGLVYHELHAVKDKPIKIVLESADVIHDLGIPAMRVKKDAVPGRYNRTWFQPTEAGTFDIYCAMYCGQNHSTMRAALIVHPDQASFDAWMKDVIDWRSKMSYVDRGKQLYTQAGCANCHSVDGGPGTGPTWKNMYGTMQPLTDGEAMADDAYIRESILKPQAKIVRGFGPVMPAFNYETDDLEALVWYMRSISNAYKGDMKPGMTVGAAVGPTHGPATSPVTQPVAVPQDAIQGFKPKRPIETSPGK